MLDFGAWRRVNASFVVVARGMRGRGMSASLAEWGVALRTKMVQVKGRLTITGSEGPVTVIVRPALRVVVVRIGVVLAEGCWAKGRLVGRFCRLMGRLGGPKDGFRAWEKSMFVDHVMLMDEMQTGETSIFAFIDMSRVPVLLACGSTGSPGPMSFWLCCNLYMNVMQSLLKHLTGRAIDNRSITLPVGILTFASSSITSRRTKGVTSKSKDTTVSKEPEGVGIRVNRVLALTAGTMGIVLGTKARTLIAFASAGTCGRTFSSLEAAR